MRRRFPLRSLLVLVAAASAACAWSVPADPGANARLRRPPSAPGPAARGAGDPAVAALYAEKCGACHAPFPTTHATAGAWPTYVRRYGPRAGLFGEERARVLAYLQANAR